MYHPYDTARALAAAHVADLQMAQRPGSRKPTGASAESGPPAICQLLRKAIAVARLTLIGTPAP